MDPIDTRPVGDTDLIDTRPGCDEDPIDEDPQDDAKPIALQPRWGDEPGPTDIRALRDGAPACHGLSSVGSFLICFSDYFALFFLEVYLSSRLSTPVARWSCSSSSQPSSQVPSSAHSFHCL